MKTGSVLLLAALLPLAPAFAGTITLHFDELGTGSPVYINNPVSISGVTFGFSPGAAQYNGSIGAGTTVNLSDPVLMGPTSGVLTLDFAVPVTILNFDIAMESVDPILNAYTVTIGSKLYSGDTTPSLIYSEGSFSYPDALPFSSASIQFSAAAPEFAIDNLTFSAPEPGTGFLIPAALLSLALAAGLKRGRTAERRIG